VCTVLQPPGVNPVTVNKSIYLTISVVVLDLHFISLVSTCLPQRCCLSGSATSPLKTEVRTFNVREPGHLSQYSALAVNLMTKGRSLSPVSVKSFSSPKCPH